MIELNITTVDIIAKPRKLKAVWTREERPSFNPEAVAAALEAVTREVKRTCRSFLFQEPEKVDWTKEGF